MKLLAFEVIHSRRTEAFGTAVDARWYSVPLAARVAPWVAMPVLGLAVLNHHWAWLFAILVLLNSMVIDHVVIARVAWADGRRSLVLMAKTYFEWPPRDVHFLPLPSGRGVLVSNEVDPTHHPYLLAQGGWGFSLHHDLFAQALAAKGAKWRTATAARLRRHFERDDAAAAQHLRLVEEHFDHRSYSGHDKLVPLFVDYFKRQGMEAAELEQLRLRGTPRELKRRGNRVA